MIEETIMTMLNVSFYADMSLASRTRPVPFPRTTRAALRRQIGQSMQRGEHFACYREPEGAVFAMDRDGVVVQV